MSQPTSRPRRALLSVSDKTALVAFATRLADLSFQILSTGGTAAALRAAGLPVTDVSQVTGFPEIMDGRVKTLHPAVHAGLLARAGTDDAVLDEHGIGWIDLLVVNLYPFENVTARANCPEQEAIENIDIGGPAMLRAAAKNHARVTVVVDSNDYDRVLQAFERGEPSFELKRALAAKAFAHTGRYDALISGYLHAHGPDRGKFPDPLTLGWRLRQELRYGENPHQHAALYLDSSCAAPFKQLQGKPLSFNNLLDADAAQLCVGEFGEPACAILKHGNPCGVAVAGSAVDAYRQAYRTDPTSAFGGVIAFNGILDAPAAEAIVEQQLVDVVIAREVEETARPILAKRRNARVLESHAPGPAEDERELRTIQGGLLWQQPDRDSLDTTRLRVVTERSPTDAQMRDLQFAWRVVKWVKSNAIVYARDGATVGIGAGQTSRVMSVRIAALKADDANLEARGAVMASDAFFPFRDGIDIAAEHGISAVIQPGGSVRDGEVIEAANEHGLAMVFTGVRHFRH
jgi:phosphoribosylaminoimidazolecarboxamide formyltransferase/IMP cyclohydrolase